MIQSQIFSKNVFGRGCGRGGTKEHSYCSRKMSGSVEIHWADRQKTVKFCVPSGPLLLFVPFSDGSDEQMMHAVKNEMTTWPD